MKATASKKILIIDDHHLFSEGLALVLSSLDKTLTVSTNPDPRTLLSDTKTLASYDLFLVVLRMPSMSGFVFLQALESRKIKTPTLIVSATERRTEIEDVLKFGAKGFVPKKSLPNEILEAINSVLDGNIYIPDHLVGAIEWNIHSKALKGDALYTENTIKLSERRSEILTHIQAGHSNAQISTILNLTESTVKGHISALFKELNVRNRTTAVNKALQLGLLNPI